MNIEKWVDFVAADKKYARRMTEILAGLPNPAVREDLLRVTIELLGPPQERYGTAHPDDPPWGEALADEILHNIEILRRLEKALGSWLPFKECVVLGDILCTEHFLYDDGLLINDPRDLGISIGRSEGAALASCFDPDPRVNYLDLSLSLKSYIGHGGDLSTANTKNNFERQYTLGRF